MDGVGQVRGAERRSFLRKDILRRARRCAVTDSGRSSGRVGRTSGGCGEASA